MNEVAIQIMDIPHQAKRLNTVHKARIEELLHRYGSSTACAAELLCDRHPADNIAFTVIEADMSHTDLTYGHLREQSAKFAAALADLGVDPGDHVATLMSKSTELVIAVLGIWRRGAVHLPLFTAFATAAIDYRLDACDVRVVVVDPDQQSKLETDVRDDRTLIVAGETSSQHLAFDDLLDRYRGDEESGRPVARGADAPIVQLFTSGTSGTPKGVPIPVKALASFHAYLEFGLDVREDDVYWNAADPGWAYGLYYAVLAPLAAGRRSLLLHAKFSPSLTWHVLEQFEVTNLTAAPTVYRSLRAGGTPPSRIRLRHASSAGEPLTPEVTAWATSALGVEVRDHYGQTEHGMFIANAWAKGLDEPVREGSMGVPLPGWSCAVLNDDVDTVAQPGTQGRVAIDIANSPFMWFEGYLDAPEKTRDRFTADGRWYLTGDAGSTDKDGHFYFSARDDDVIIMAGYRIGPFDVESVLVTHDDVIDAAVVGMPDPLRGEVVEAFVVLRDGRKKDPALAATLQNLVKTKFSAHAYPRTVHFVDVLPKTPSGKIQRYLLRQRRPMTSSHAVGSQ